MSEIKVCPRCSPVPFNCQRCGRFVRREDAHVVYDGYVGGWEADPLCSPGHGCAKTEVGR